MKTIDSLIKRQQSLLSLVVVAIVFMVSCAVSSCTNYEPEDSASQEVSTSVPQGALPGLFSVAEGKQVRFAQGNLQYTTTGTYACADGTTKSGTWRFAEHQYDYLGSDNANISSSYAGWIDLFGWGTSGYNGCNPYLSSTNVSDYGPSSGDIAGSNYDWGVFNAISNGGNEAGKWRTLTVNEWEYLCTDRTDALSKCGFAMVNGVGGLVLLPDSWTTPSGCTFTSDDGWTSNRYTTTQWAAMEAAGALFLPAAGSRYGTTVSYGYYWFSTAGDSSHACSLRFGNGNLGTGYTSRYFGQSVRLVCE